MEYAVYKLIFPKGVHFGQGRLESTEMTFQADRLFSALCMEALSEGEEILERMTVMALEGRILFSDAFPYAGGEYFLPKPMLHVSSAVQEDDVSKRKLHKKLSYLPVSVFSRYLSGNMPIESLMMPNFGRSEVKVSVRLEPGEEAEPYRIGTYWFQEGCGLYILLGYEAKEDLIFIEDLLERLSFSGIGGRRSSGMGRFELHRGNFPEEGNKRLHGEYSWYMALSAALPSADEMEAALEGARYLLIKRSGFVSSVNYAPEFRRKRDSYVFQAGSCFRHRFKGQVCDVGNHGRHPVYRYLKPVFMGIGI